MTVRTDVDIDWNISPRIITIESPSTEISLQDLVDTCRYLEALTENITYDSIISASGKEDLGGGLEVGITATLLNALLAFEDCSGPTFAKCYVSGGNLVAVDGYNVSVDPIANTDYTQVKVTLSTSVALISGTGTSSTDIANAVWNSSTSSLTTSGTVGKDIAKKQDVINAHIIFDK